MSIDRNVHARLLACFADPGRGVADVDYLLLDTFEKAHGARARDGSAALVVPLSEIPSAATGRRTSGCELVGHQAVVLNLPNGKQTCAAAALVCRDSDLLNVFAVLCEDIVAKTSSECSWRTIVSAVDEWMNLLTPKGRPSDERELGMWGELWFVEGSQDVQRMLAGWRGPERDAVDFFVEGISIDVKTSRKRQQHFVSQSQVDSPVGDYAAWLLSIWVKTDPGLGRTVPQLVDAIIDAAPDRADALRQIVGAGYSPTDRAAYTSRFVALEEPGWFAANKVPRVRAADPGVSKLRYQVELSDELRANQQDARKLWVHFHGTPYESKS